MNQAKNLLSQLIVELNQHYQMKLELEEGQRCAFLDEQGIYFQLEQRADTDQVLLTAAIGQVNPQNSEQLLNALSLNADTSLDGAWIALSPDRTTLLLLRTLQSKLIGDNSLAKWLFPFIAKARLVSSQLVVTKNHQEADNEKVNITGQNSVLKWG